MPNALQLEKYNPASEITVLAVCLVMLVAMLVLRTLKHHSRLLAAEENRD